MTRFLAVVHLYEKTAAARVLTRMVVPDWAHIVSWGTFGAFQDSLVLKFESDSPDHFHATPEACEPPYLAMAGDEIVWTSLDGSAARL